MIINLTGVLTGCSKTIALELIKESEELYKGHSFNSRMYIIDELKDNQNIKIDNPVNIEKPGDYNVIYSLKGITKILRVTIKKDPLLLTRYKVTIPVGEDFDPKTFIKEAEFFDSIVISNPVNNQVPGVYTVSYFLLGQTKTLEVTVDD